MSHSDSFTQNGSMPAAPAQAEHVADLERLIPQNLSNNKRAVIERLIELYKRDAKSELFSSNRQRRSA